MTSQNGFDRTLSDWLATENAPDVPDWVYEGAFAEVRTTGQSRPMADALTRWLRPRDTLPGPRPQGLGARSTVSFATPVILVVALLIVALATAALLVGASRLLPDRLFPQDRFHAAGSIADPGTGLPGTLTSLPDGRALLTDGSALDLFDPATGQFVRSDSHLSVPRMGETATLLRDGTVLIVGGGAKDQASPSSGGSQAEIFDPATGAVTLLGPTLEPHVDGSATLLADGRVLLAGADPLNRPSASAEFYDPKTQSFRRTGPTTLAKPFHRAVLLDDGRVLIVGGRNHANDGVDAIAEVFDPTTERFSATEPMAINEGGSTATALSDGRVLLVGGYEWDPARNVTAVSDAVQIFDPAKGTFALAGRLPTPRTGHAAVLLEDGDILVMGGEAEGDADTPVALTEALRWEHETGEFVPAGSMTRARNDFLATLLQDGRVLMIGHYPWNLAEPLRMPDEEELQSTWSAEVFE